jgi:pyruvate dehydrogenase E2 component (dihydrolipoamide acetyltransferase)
MGSFKMPSLGSDMEAGTLVEWLKKPGDHVHRGDIVAVVETEKGAIEIEIFEDGQFEKLLVAPGTKVPVGTVLATLVGDEEPAAVAPQPAIKPEILTTAGQPTSVEVIPAISTSTSTRLRVSPAARRIARERNIDLAKVQGSGLGSAIISTDLVRTAQPTVTKTELDLEPMRRAIAAAMSRSKREIPHYYLSHSMNVEKALSWLEQYNANREPADRLLFAALLIKASALALRDYPEFNGFFKDGVFEVSTSIHVGFAIAIRGGGLAAPAIHACDKLTLSELMGKLRDLVGRVRRGGFRSSEISDPTVTISSLGERGVEALFPIIYPPQVAILGFGTPLPRPWSVDGRIETQHVMVALLAADHRVSDGHRGALLLQRIGELLNTLEAMQ